MLTVFLCVIVTRLLLQCLVYGLIFLQLVFLKAYFLIFK